MITKFLDDNEISGMIRAELNTVEGYNVTKPFDYIVINKVRFLNSYLVIMEYDIEIRSAENNLLLGIVEREMVEKFHLSRQEITEEKVEKTFF